MIGLMLIVSFAVFYYMVGEKEYDKGWLLAAVSVVLYAVGGFVFRFGFIGSVLLQVGLFAGLTFYNMKRRSE
jgi:hypothetical protein